MYTDMDVEVRTRGLESERTRGMAIRTLVDSPERKY